MLLLFPLAIFNDDYVIAIYFKKNTLIVLIPLPAAVLFIFLFWSQMLNKNANLAIIKTQTDTTKSHWAADPVSTRTFLEATTIIVNHLGRLK